MSDRIELENIEEMRRQAGIDDLHVPALLHLGHGRVHTPPPPRTEARRAPRARPPGAAAAGSGRAPPGPAGAAGRLLATE
jgi:hypothetical protein